MEKPRNLPTFRTYLNDAGIDPDALLTALTDYVNDVTATIQDEFSHYDSPFEWLAAKQHEAAIVAFLDEIAAEL